MTDMIDPNWTRIANLKARIAVLAADVSFLSAEVRVQAAANDQHKADARAAVLAEREACVQALYRVMEEDHITDRFVEAIRARPAP